MKRQLLCGAVSILFFFSTIIHDVDGTFCWTKNDPEHIRLALRPNGVSVSWTTRGYSNKDDTPTPQVAFSTNQNALNSISNGSTTTYHPLPILKRFFHNVHLDGLLPSTKYFYRIQATTKCVRESSVRSFTTAPDTNAAFQPVNLSIVADLGLNNYFNQYQAEKTIAAMQTYASSSNLFMHVGDISYADLYGVIVNFDLYENTWNRFQQAIEPITSAMPYQVSPGNHEATCFQYSSNICPSFF